MYVLFMYVVMHEMCYVCNVCVLCMCVMHVRIMYVCIYVLHMYVSSNTVTVAHPTTDPN